MECLKERNYCADNLVVYGLRIYSLFLTLVEISVILNIWDPCIKNVAHNW